MELNKRNIIGLIALVLALAAFVATSVYMLNFYDRFTPEQQQRREN